MARQRVRRNVGRQIVWNLGALAIAGVAVWSVLSIELALARWGIAAVAAVVAFLVWGYGNGTAGRVDCPHCGARIDGVDPKVNRAALCTRCMTHATGDDGTVDVTPIDFVAPLPVFGAELPPAIEWGDGCCVCQAPVTRLVEVTLVDETRGSAGRDFAVGVASLGVLKAVDRTTYRLAAPHCAQHSDGVALVHPVGDDLSIALAFRSYAVFRQFVLINHAGTRKTIRN